MYSKYVGILFHVVLAYIRSSHGSVVNTATRLQAQPKEIFLTSKYVCTGPGAHPVSTPMGTRVLSWGSDG
jgi:hypothetical protein